MSCRVSGKYQGRRPFFNLFGGYVLGFGGLPPVSFCLLLECNIFRGERSLVSAFLEDISILLFSPFERPERDCDTGNPNTLLRIKKVRGVSEMVIECVDSFWMPHVDKPLYN